MKKLIPLSSIHSTGAITACHSCAQECHYHCCTQQKPATGEMADPSNSILLYPGEWDQQTVERRKHIVITGEQFGGRFGYCDAKRINQSQCHPSQNFKPLDCKSYPFFPSFIDDTLVLLIDRRCPLTPDNEPKLNTHYYAVLETWKRLIDERPKIRTWLLSLVLPSYQVYNPNNK